MALAFRYINNVHPDLKDEMRYFGKWLRQSYQFPTPLEIRLVCVNRLVDFDGTKCNLRWWQNSRWPESFKGEIAVKSFVRNLQKEGPSVAFPTVIAAIGRVISYYNQAISDLPASEMKATVWGDKLMDSYIKYRDKKISGKTR